MDTVSLKGGFDNAPHAASVAFRALMNAMARPGTIEPLSGAAAPAPLSTAAATLLLTLADHDTPLFLAGGCDTPAVRDWIAFHTGAPIAQRAEATFALGAWDALLPLGDYRIGTPEYPDRSATLIVEMARLSNKGTPLRGPGIKDAASLALPDPATCAANNALFPLGLDFYFTAQDRVAALPRSTRIG